MTQTFLYDPDDPLVSMFRALKEYIETGVNNSVKYFTTPSGSLIYEVVDDFPASVESPRPVPFVNADGDPVTLIHFVIDDITTRKLGLGPDHYNYETVGSDPNVGIIDHEAGIMEVNFDIGVWATDSSGGTTSRLQAFQILWKLLNGAMAAEACMAATQGIEIRSFSRGRFITDQINDQTIFRVVGTELVVRIFTRKKSDQSTEVDDIVLDPSLIISDQIPIELE